MFEPVRGRNVSRYEQFEASPETIEQELRAAVCERRQTDLRRTSHITVERKLSVCVMCLKYKILILIMIIITLGQILLSYFSNTPQIR